MIDSPLLEVHDLVKHFPVREGLLGREVAQVRAVDGLSFTMAPGETLGIVGESGCGKTTLGKLVVRLLTATAGRILFEGDDLAAAKGGKLRRLRRNLQIVFQDPFASLDPRMTVAEIVGEPFAIHGIARGADRADRVAKLLDAVGLAVVHAGRYPHEFSGGQRQRIGIARALALNPRLIVCDEPVSALDVSVQSQILNLLTDLQAEFGLSYLFIAHGLAAVRHISDRVGVMYLGKLVELAPADRLFAEPAHPYTRALITAIPLPDPTAPRSEVVLEGDVPSPIDPPSGCRFHTRCPYAARVGERCWREEPELREIAPGHLAACHLYTTDPPTGR